jgi:DNA-binding protein HU-beta
VTKQEFVEQVATKSQLTRRDAQKAVDAFLDVVTETLKNGGEVHFTGFGKFSAQHRKERQGVNPRNPGEKVTIPAANVPKFSAGSSLKAAVKGK